MPPSPASRDRYAGLTGPAIQGRRQGSIPTLGSSASPGSSGSVSAVRTRGRPAPSTSWDRGTRARRRAMLKLASPPRMNTLPSWSTQAVAVLAWLEQVGAGSPRVGDRVVDLGGSHERRGSHHLALRRPLPRPGRVRRRATVIAAPSRAVDIGATVDHRPEAGSSRATPTDGNGSAPLTARRFTARTKPSSSTTSRPMYPVVVRADRPRSGQGRAPTDRPPGHTGRGVRGRFECPADSENAAIRHRHDL